MEISWSTFLVEIVNFVVLVWLLTRFLYRPVMRAIAFRQTALAQEMQRAEQLKKEADESSKRYEARLSDWEREKAALREQFERSLLEERARRETELGVVLQRERERAEASQRVRDRESEERLERQAAAFAASFAARLLARVASPSLETSLVAAIIDDIGSLSAERRALLARAFDAHKEVTVVTRYPIGDAQRGAVQGALAVFLGAAPSISFTQDETLLAGVRIDLGTVTLEGSLAGELRWFAQGEARVAG
jgi:F-type H+-transporting ATPase subunit b